MLPTNTLSVTPVVAAYIPPDERPRTLLVDWEMGGIALNDASLGLLVRVWKAWYDGTSIWVAPETDLGSAVAVVTASGITEVSLAFDQAMHVTLTYVQAGAVKLYWYDSTIPGSTTTTFAGASTPMLCLDDKRPEQTSTNDILFFYVNGGTNLCYRQQRDRFTIERVLATVPGDGRIISVGMHQGLRVQIHYGDLPGPGIHLVIPAVMLGARRRSMQPSIGDVPKFIPENHTRFLLDLKRNVEMFTGARGPVEAKIIVRGDIQVADVPAMSSAHAAGANPTQDEFNALVDDYAALYVQLSTLITVMRD